MLRIPPRVLVPRTGISARALVPSRSATSSAHTLNPAGTVTTLPNKLRVATESMPGHFHAVGVYIDAGSRYESQQTSGVSHLLDRLAFKSTDKHTDNQMTTLIDSLGSQVTCASSRETIMYQSTVFPQSLPLAMELIASTIRHPLLLPQEVETQKEAAAYEIREIWAKPELILPEIVHTVAFKDNTLGMPLLCPEAQIPVLGGDQVRRFMKDWYRPERMVVAGVGMPHEELVQLAERFFGDIPASPAADSSDGDYAALRNARAEYTGGELYVEKPEEEFVHLHVGFEGLGIHDPDIYALATLQTLLGGGGSFSAGGPGKGMYTRLYTKVLNQYHAVDFCSAFHHCYADSGLFGISASVYPQFAGKLVDVIGGQLHALTGKMWGGIEPIEVMRAKNMLKSSLTMALESRLTAVEDLGRQVQIHGHKVPVADMCDKIDALTMEDLHRVALRILRPSAAGAGGRLNYGVGSGRATVVAQGPGLDRLGDVRKILRDRWQLGL